MQRVLLLEQTPPLSVPLRFFFTAPLFAMAAALLLLWHGEQALQSRWSPITLALTHLLTLGFLGQAMIGALLQILPVAANVRVPALHKTAGAVHLLLGIGAAMLAAAFLVQERWLFRCALALLGPAFAILLGACWFGLRNSAGGNAMLRAIRLALLALAVTAGIGLVLGSAFAWPLHVPLMMLTDVHATWGLAGWIGLLVIGVAYQVVPMFQVTELYPTAMRHGLTIVLFGLLVAWTCAVALPVPRFALTLPALLAGAGYTAFAMATLHLLYRRKRPRADAAASFLYCAFASLLACIVVWTAGSVMPHIAAAPAYPLLLGILFIGGFAYSIVNGMLYKIVPFLVWLHLDERRINALQPKPPNVRDIIGERTARGQFVAHMAALALLIAAAWPVHWMPQWIAQHAPQLTRLAALAFFASSAWLWLNLLLAIRCYRRHAQHYF